MADAAEVTLDRSQVKKAVQALQAFMKTTSTSDSLLLNESQQISLLFTLWRIPKKTQTIRIPLPHGQRTDTDEICLFTKDEPKMTAEQTQRFYKRLLEEKGVKNISEIIPYKLLRTEYKPYEAKRRLLGNFDVFISDDRIRRLLPSHLGKHFYQRKKEPLCVNLLSKNLARDIENIIQGTKLNITNKGCCNMARIGHSAMTADELTENIEATVKTLVTKLRMKGPVIKVIHLKSEKSVALPIYNSNLSNISILQKSENKAVTPKDKVGAAKKQADNKQSKDTEEAGAAEGKAEEETNVVQAEEEEEIPQLVPIETPSKKPKLEKPVKKKLQKAPKPAAVKRGTRAQSKLTKTAGKTESKVKRKSPKVK